ncbi:MAG: flagellar hook-basal body protein [Proteocatella sp.]
MNQSFYTASVGAGMHQSRLDIISNNLANINTDGYKTKNSVFSNLIYNNINEAQQSRSLKSGTGIKVDQTETDFSQGQLSNTGSNLDYAIRGAGYFAVQSPVTREVFYTRDGSFMMSQPVDFDGDNFNLVSKEGYYVLDSNQEPIVIANAEELPDIGVFTFQILNGMESLGDGKFKPTPKNGTPELVLEGEILERGSVEMSNVDLAREMSKIVETQRAYQFAIKMIQTSDEITGMVNSLR